MEGIPRQRNEKISKFLDSEVLGQKNKISVAPLICLSPGQSDWTGLDDWQQCWGPLCSAVSLPQTVSIHGNQPSALTLIADPPAPLVPCH